MIGTVLKIPIKSNVMNFNPLKNISSTDNINRVKKFGSIVLIVPVFISLNLEDEYRFKTSL